MWAHLVAPMTEGRWIGWLLPAGAGLALASLASLALVGRYTGPAERLPGPAGSVAASLAPTEPAAVSPAPPAAAIDIAAIQRFQGFLQRLEPEAELAGVSRKTFLAATRGLTPDEEVLTLSRGQPEFVTPPWDYLARLVTETRIEGGRLNLARHEAPHHVAKRFVIRIIKRAQRPRPFQHAVLPTESRCPRSARLNLR